MHGKICVCPNCRGPAGTAAMVVVVVVLVAAAAQVAVWLAVAAGVLLAVAAAVAWLSWRLAPLSVAMWTARWAPGPALLPKAPLPAVEAAPARLAIEAPGRVVDGVVVRETSERMPG